MAFQLDLIVEHRRDWELWRQDDGGNQYLVERYATREDAEHEMRVFEGRGHRQVYWVRHHPVSA